jgi:apolipoprotein D and lipocalin family protein
MSVVKRFENMKRLFKSLVLLPLLLLSGCLGVPDGVTTVDEFNLERYLGRWYEIARLDHSFERGLSYVTAEYSMLDDGGVKVVNRGFNKAAGKWKEATGKAYPVADPDTGRLKVSFFGPFYSAYNIIALDQENYSYSLVSGPNRSYLWILSREPQMDPVLYKKLVQQASDLGFPTDDLIYVDHSREMAPTRRMDEQ